MDKQPLVIEQRIRYKLRRFKRAIAAGRQANGRRLPTMHPIVVCARRACKHLAAALQPV